MNFSCVFNQYQTVSALVGYYWIGHIDARFKHEEEYRLRLTSETKVHVACSFMRNITPALSWYLPAVLI